MSSISNRCGNWPLTGGRRKTEWLNFFSSPPALSVCLTTLCFLGFAIPQGFGLYESLAKEGLSGTRLSFRSPSAAPEWPNTQSSGKRWGRWPVAHLKPCHHRGDDTEVTRFVSLYIHVLFQVGCTCAFLTTLVALMFSSQSSGKL